MRYAATYLDVKGRQLSAGTFSTEAQATRAWQKAEEKIAEGPPHHQMEARNRANYTYYLGKHILPAFGTMRLVEILPVDVREWVTELKNWGLSPTVIRSCFAILSAVFTTAFNDQLTALHPCRGVKTPRTGRASRQAERQR